MPRKPNYRHERIERAKAKAAKRAARAKAKADKAEKRKTDKSLEVPADDEPGGALGHDRPTAAGERFEGSPVPDER